MVEVSLPRGGENDDQDHGGGDARRSNHRALIPLAVYAALALLWFHGIWLSSEGLRQVSRRQIGVAGDPQMFLWYLSWAPFAVRHGHNLLFTQLLMAPGGANLLSSTSILVPALLMSPVTLLFGPVVAYNVLTTAAVALGAWAGYLVCRRFTTSEPAAVVCGLVYGFSPYMQSQSLSHPNLSIVVFPPLALALLHELLIRQRRRPIRVGALLGVAAVFELLTSAELLLTSAVMAAGLVAVLCLVCRDQVRRKAAYALRGLGAAVVVALLLGGGFLAYQLTGRQHFSGLAHHPNTYVSDPRGIVLPSRYQFVSTPHIRARTDTLRGFDGEFSTYLGIPMLALLALAAWRQRSRRTMQVAASMFAATVVLSLGGALRITHSFSVPLPWTVANRIPILEIALPSRLMLYAYLAAGIMLALFIEDLARRQSRLARRLGWGGVGLVLLFLFPTPNPPTTAVVVPPFFRSSAVKMIPAGTTVLATPLYGVSIPPMAWQWSANFRFRLAQGAVITPRGYGTTKTALYETLNMVEGYSILHRRVVGCEAIATMLTEPCRQRLLADIRALRIGAIVVGNGPNEGRVLEISEALAGRPGRRVGGVTLWILPAPRHVG